MDRAPQGRSRWAAALTAALSIALTGAAGFDGAPTPAQLGFLAAAALTAAAAALPGTDGSKKSDTVRLIPTASKKKFPLVAGATYSGPAQSSYVISARDLWSGVWKSWRPDVWRFVWR